ncbi:uncharacterized protein LOC119837961 isoform X3 [Zerene cesonia]|uniref:uncharacterized protein LOC119837961 isoform X3 n=1 Tax=Zerene cesonia TaxID=33412 RepID=UPI0018E4E390|nr:uncharacterized protein LOC119837961 isoform X3 [Zerene cesonia]XP_038219688.1 uncharacterized protein LOC119837961 isoform X3 [Zerene cesonia]
MSCKLIVRRSVPGDIQKRQEIIRNSYSTGFIDTFLFFFFQELTLECCVLSGAVLFIFCGVSARGCLLLVPAAVAVVTAAVLLQQYTLSLKHAQSIHGEIFGVVVEARGALLPPPGALPICVRLNDGLPDENQAYMYTHWGLRVCRNFGGPCGADGCTRWSSTRSGGGAARARRWRAARAGSPRPPACTRSSAS